MEYYNKILCVTFAELTGGRDPVMKANTLKCNVQRCNIACARRGGGEGLRHCMCGAVFRRSTDGGLWRHTATQKKRCERL